MEQDLWTEKLNRAMKQKAFLIKRTTGHPNVRSSGEKRPTETRTEEGIERKGSPKREGPCYPGEELWDPPGLVNTHGSENHHGAESNTV